LKRSAVAGSSARSASAARVVPHPGHGTWSIVATGHLKIPAAITAPKSAIAAAYIAARRACLGASCVPRSSRVFPFSMAESCAMLR
jgi:hypothetical protein